MPRDSAPSAIRLRQEERIPNPVPPARLLVHYHAALMEGWEGIVAEQFDLLRFCGLSTLNACCLGAERAVERFSSMAAGRGLQLTIDTVSSNLSEFEHPSLCQIWKRARENQDAAFLYFHTKGVSSPADAMKTKWRRAMQKFVLARWRENLELLGVYDAVGANWQELPRFSHFSGNFWMARAGWLALLENPETYRASGQQVQLVSRPWDQMHAETWIGSRPGGLVRSWAGINMGWWRTGADLARVNVEIEGFSYEPYDREVRERAG
ncbi:MAG: hypothetical protein L6R30_22560 [Thermoanaerobaculia bacterium]|nr:hypothetical protein [Thermoanaerobaculia bacterium]